LKSCFKDGDSLKKFILIFCLLLALIICLVLSAFSYAADSGYHITKRLAVGGEGGWDYLTVDEAAQFTQPKESTQSGSKQRPEMVKGSFELLVVGK
jgi:hypothetical protein